MTVNLVRVQLFVANGRLSSHRKENNKKRFPLIKY